MLELFRYSLTPWVVAALLLLAGALMWRVARRLGPGWRKRVLASSAAIVVVVGIAATVGVASMTIARQRVLGAQSPPGVMVDVGGYRVHLRCEGERLGRTIVWLSGGYGQALWLDPLHRQLRQVERSCVIDRAGLGWSDASPEPPTMSRALRELHEALARAGESPPFVLAGHSLGGAMAVNYAVAYPQQVQALFLMDPTSPAYFDLYPICPASAPAWRVLGASFGLGLIDALNPLQSDRGEMRELRAKLRDVWPVLSIHELRPTALLGNFSFGNSSCGEPLAWARAPGVLGDVPLLMIVQADATAERWKREMPKTLSEVEQRNYMALMGLARHQFVQFSSRGQLDTAPPGLGHWFPVLDSEWTSARLERFLQEQVASASRADDPKPAP